MKRSIVRLAGTGTLVAFTSCSAWHEKRPPADYVMKQRPPEVRLTTPDTTVTMRAPFVRGDSLIGKSTGSGAGAGYAKAAAVALAEIRRLEVREWDNGKTIALIGGLALLGVIVIAAAVAAGTGTLLEGGIE